MADATNNETPTGNPVADLENENEHPEAKGGVTDPNASDALDEALRAEGFNVDGTALKADDIKPAAKPAADGTPKPDTNTPAPTDNTPKPDSNTPAPADNTPKPDTNTPAAKDDLDSIELPPHTKPKTAESFANVKNLARTKIAAIEKERDEQKARADKAEEAAKKAPTPEETKELEELRAFRRKVDVEADPSFKEFDTKSTRNVDMIYSKLEASGFDKETIAKIKEMGGPASVNWDDLESKGKIPTSLRRYVQGKLFENDDLKEQKKLAIDAAKKNADEYLKNREAEMAKSEDDLVQETAKEWDGLKPKVDWLVKQEITDKMKPEEKALAEEHNKLVEGIETDLKDALQDTSPRMKALLIAGYAVGRKMSWEFTRLKTATDAKIASLTKDLEAANSRLERIKGASPGRVNSSAPAATPAKKVTASSHVHATDRGDHLDQLLAEAQAAEAAKE